MWNAVIGYNITKFFWKHVAKRYCQKCYRPIPMMAVKEALTGCILTSIFHPCYHFVIFANLI